MKHFRCEEQYKNVKLQHKKVESKRYEMKYLQKENVLF